MYTYLKYIFFCVKIMFLLFHILTQHDNFDLRLVRTRFVLGVDVVHAGVLPLRVIDGDLGEVVLRLHDVVRASLYLQIRINRTLVNYNEFVTHCTCRYLHDYINVSIINAVTVNETILNITIEI